MGSITLLNVLSDDLILDIMANVSARSLTDFFNLKLCCSDLRSLAEEKYTYKRISLESLPFLDWKGKTTKFIKNCVESNNPEALYREGLMRFFSRGKFKSGLNYLKSAADEGYLQACYVLAMIFIFNGGADEQVRQLGFGFLGRVCEAGKEIECRKKMKAALDYFWPKVDHTWFIHQKPDDQSMEKHACMKKHYRTNVREWSEEYNYFEDKNCIQCRCDAEIERFDKTFNWIRFPFYGPSLV